MVSHTRHNAQPGDFEGSMQTRRFVASFDTYEDDDEAQIRRREERRRRKKQKRRERSLPDEEGDPDELIEGSKKSRKRKKKKKPRPELWYDDRLEEADDSVLEQEAGLLENLDWDDDWDSNSL